MADKLLTEAQNPSTEWIDQQSISTILQWMNNEDATVASAVKNELPYIGKAIETIVERLQNGGRLFYIGAGTSGRLGVLDASECPPTFNVPNTLVQGIIAGGTYALTNAVENVEDNRTQAIEDIQQYGLAEKDVLIGIAASGRTPYVIAALQYAQQQGIYTISLSCNKNSGISQFANICIEVETGPEVIAGSTRLKAGTAQKMVLNMLTTATMIKLNKVYSNIMIDVQATNEKLRRRALSILKRFTQVDEVTGTALLEQTNYNIRMAIVMYNAKVSLEQAKEALQQQQGNIAETIRLLKGGTE